MSVNLTSRFYEKELDLKFIIDKLPFILPKFII